MLDRFSAAVRISDRLPGVLKYTHAQESELLQRNHCFGSGTSGFGYAF
jgi:hypothetical protein